MPNGPIAILGGSTGNGPQSIGNGKSIPWFVTRYLRRNEATTDYGIIPTVTLSGDFVIECDFTFNGASNSKLMGHTSNALGGLWGVNMDGDVVVRHSNSWSSLGIVPNLVAGTLYKARLFRTNGVIGSSINGVSAPSTTGFSGDWIISQIWRAFGSSMYEYLAGILANLKIYDDGVLVRDYPINDNSNTLKDLASGQDGSIVNGTADQWKAYQKQTTGEWLGPELVTQALWEVPSGVGAQWSFLGNEWTLTGDGSLSALVIIGGASQPDVMRITGEIIAIDQNRLAVTESSGIGDGQVDSVGLYSHEWSKSIKGAQQFKRAGGAITATISKPSIKEVLNVA
jgi:hypothetical protein